MIRTFTLMLTLGLSAAVAADGPESANVRGESTTTRKRLAELEQRILVGKSLDAIDELQRILDEVGDDLVTADGKQFSSARHYAHRFLAKLPDAELKRYRDRVEEPAAKLLARGRAMRDPAILLNLLDRYAISRPAEDAILLLAELAFERGEFATAEYWWGRLLATSDPKFPAPKSKTADLEARIIASTIRRGDRVTAARLLEPFARTHAESSGRLAGRTGLYRETLQGLLTAPALPSDRAVESAWSTLAANVSRSGAVASSFPRFWPNRPTWTAPIPLLDDTWRGRAGRPPSVGAVKSLAYHPVVMGQSAYLATAGRIFAFDLRTGQASLCFDSARIERPIIPPRSLAIPSTVDADYSLTAADGKLYLRFGPPELFPTAEPGSVPPVKPSLLIALAPAPDRKPAQILWKRSPPVEEDIPASWEGAPIVLDDRIYATFVRSDGGRLIHAVACYGGDSERPLWVTDLCEENSESPRTRHELLTHAGRNLVFCSHSGAIAAVNAKTGRRAWAYRYPRIRQFAADGRHRDLSPPVFADGRVFVAPNDADQLIAFEAETGTPLWTEGPIRVDHIIGAASGKVVAAIAGPQRGLRGYDAATGSSDFPNGWRNHDDPFLPSFGRGLVSQEFVAWPTAAALYILRLVDGTVAAQPIRGPHGNLAFANGVLLVATPTELRAYVSDADDPEPVTPKPQVFGKLAPLPEEKPGKEPASTLPPTVGRPAKIERVSTPSEGLSLNVGDLDVRADVGRLIRRTSAGTVAIDSNGRSAKLPFANPTSAVWMDDRVLLASERGLALVEPFAANLLWTRDLAGITAVLPFPGGVLLRIGEHQLLAVHRTSGETAWALNSRGQPTFTTYAIESSPRFLGMTFLGQRLIAQRSNGTRWLIDARTGMVLQERQTVDREWLDTPIVLDADRTVLADGPNRITMIDGNGRAIWSRELGREASLTGEPATVQRVGSLSVAVVRRNQGVELELLSLLDGSLQWRDPPVFAVGSLERDSLAADRQYLFAAIEDILIAIRLDSGRAAWSSRLPLPARWRTLVLRNRLLLYPVEAVSFEPASPFRSFVQYPNPRRILGLLGTAFDDYFARTVPFLLFDLQTGELQQRLDWPAAGAVSVRPSADGLLVAAGGSILRLH